MASSPQAHPVLDTHIVRAAIYPAIGIARVGNSPEEYFIGPEVLAPLPVPSGFYKDAQGALKRQAARFRVYGLNQQGQVVQELTADDATIDWQVHVANKKAAWYEFNTALDIPQAQAVQRRNANFTGADRARLVIDPGAVEIGGRNVQGEDFYFDKGSFLGTPVYLGELRTDEAGRLLFLGGRGVSGTPFEHNPPTTFANNDGWHDDTADGPVHARVTYQGRKLPVQAAWVVCAPPNYAPDIIGVQTMYDVITDALTGAYLTPKTQPSFLEDIYPLLLQLSQNQWVNQGFFVAYGHDQPYDFANAELARKLGVITKDDKGCVTDEYREYRRQIFNYFRSPKSTQIEPQRWPWMYGDNMGVPATTANGYLSVTHTLHKHLKEWAKGNFKPVAPDWTPELNPPYVPLEEIGDAQAQADMLTKAALWYCLGGPFHPGCELTWPMRLSGMYTGPYRVRHRSANNPEPDYGPLLKPSVFANTDTSPAGVFWNGPGDLTRWMACPWQTDTASCRAGYESLYDPLVPTFWPARVPNTVLTEKDYQAVLNHDLPMDKRQAAFNRRASWYRILGDNYLQQIQCMVERYGDLGVVEQRPGPGDTPLFPAVLYVESPPCAPGGPAQATALPAARLTALAQPEAARAAPPTRAELADQIPYDRGLYVGQVGRGAPKSPAVTELLVTPV